jgi:hypothetical protein
MGISSLTTSQNYDEKIASDNWMKTLINWKVLYKSRRSFSYQLTNVFHCLLSLFYFNQKLYLPHLLESGELKHGYDVRN